MPASNERLALPEREVWTRRQLIDDIRWRTRTGAPWRDVPGGYGPWDRVYDLLSAYKWTWLWQDFRRRRSSR
ncbi:transposase [Streptomyces sp. NPDC057686]|uniref:transposase n=1 Tax=Streptomyces sp. NPDC057686 TaxID=3346212 RepID=UPI003677B4F2